LALFSDYFLEDIVQMLDFMPPPPDKKRRHGGGEDDTVTDGDEKEVSQCINSKLFTCDVCNTIWDRPRLC